jgi:hypothetical protein
MALRVLARKMLGLQQPAIGKPKTFKTITPLIQLAG